MAPTGDSREPAGNRNLRTRLLPEFAHAAVSHARLRRSGVLALDVSVAPKEEEVIPAAAEEEEVAPPEVVKATVSNDENDEEYSNSSDSADYYHSLDGGMHVVCRVDYSSGNTLYSCPVCQDREFEYKEEVQVHALRLFRNNVAVPDDIERHRQIAQDAGYRSALKKRSTSS